MDPLTFLILAALIPLWVPAVAVLAALSMLFLVLIWAGVVNLARGYR